MYILWRCACVHMHVNVCECECVCSAPVEVAGHAVGVTLHVRTCDSTQLLRLVAGST